MCRFPVLLLYPANARHCMRSDFGPCPLRALLRIFSPNASSASCSLKYASSPRSHFSPISLLRILPLLLIVSRRHFRHTDLFALLILIFPPLLLLCTLLFDTIWLILAAYSVDA